MRIKLILVLVIVMMLGSLTANDLPDPYDTDITKTFKVNIDSLGYEAWKAYQRGDYETSASYYLAALQYDIKNGSSLYNLACCYGLLGKDKLAATYLQIAYKNGFNNLGHIQTDPDFEKVRKSEVFKATMDSLIVWDKKKSPYLGERHFIQSKVFAEYQVFLPEGYSKDKTYPIMIGLHGYGDNLAGFAKVLRYMDDREIIYVVPEAPYPFMVGNDVGFSWSLFNVTDDEKLVDQSFGMAADYVMDIYDEVTEEYPTDEVYLMGFSQGCMLTYVTGIPAADKFSGLICLGGELFLFAVEDHLEKAKDLPIYIIHGKSDNMIGFESAEKAVEVLKAHDMTYHLEAFDGGHTIDGDSFKKALEYFDIE